MSDEPDQQPDEKPFRFSMRTLMLVMTGVCAIAAFLAMYFDSFTQIVVWAVILEFSFLGAFTYYAYRKSKSYAWTLPMDTVTVKVDAKWIRRIRSPWFYLVCALTGVSVSFAPLYLWWCGSEVSQYGLLEWVLVPLSFLTIYFVPGFYMRFARDVIHQLLEHKISDQDTSEKAAEESTSSSVG